MKNYTILLISILLLLFVNKTAVEGFISEQGTCIVGSNQYEELKSKIESINFDEIKLKLFTITRRVDEIEDKLNHALKVDKEKQVTICVHPFIAAYLSSGLFSKRMSANFGFFTK